LFSCSNKQSSQFEKSQSVAIKSVTEYRDGNKIHYREYDLQDNELLHIYFRNENQIEKEIFTYDTKGNLLSKKQFLNDSILNAVEYTYEFDQEQRPTKISSSTGAKTEREIIEYVTQQDTVVEVRYLNERDYNEGKWRKKLYFDKEGKWLGSHYNKIYGGAGDGERHINHYGNNGKLSFQIHFYLGFDTTFFHYNEQNQLIKTSKKGIGREHHGEYEYDRQGNKCKWVSTEIVYYQGDTLVNNWTYDWKTL